MGNDQVRLFYKTAKGTELPLLNLRGKLYLLVAHRILWFREEHPRGLIEVEFIKHDNDHTIAKAKIYNENKELIAVAHKREDKIHFPDHLEKAETGAIGRALAMIGYGTQFTGDELYEGERLADAPIEVKPSTTNKLKAEVAELISKLQLKKEDASKMFQELTKKQSSKEWEEFDYNIVIQELNSLLKNGSMK